eukprot:1161288-Pelagomonas_calceolata.AAC.9
MVLKPLMNAHNNGCSRGHALPRSSMAALTGLAAQCWLGCSTQRMAGSRPACTRLAFHQGQVPQNVKSGWNFGDLQAR